MTTTKQTWETEGQTLYVDYLRKRVGFKEPMKKCRWLTLKVTPEEFVGLLPGKGYRMTGEVKSLGMSVGEVGVF